MDTITFANGARYRTHDALSSSSGSIGIANIRVLLAECEGRYDAWTQLQLNSEVCGIATKRTYKEHAGLPAFEHRLPMDDCLLVTDVFGGESIYLLADDFDGLIDALDEYPIIDDAVVADVEAEQEERLIRSSNGC